MNSVDKKILYLIDLLIFNNKIDNVRQFCKKIGMLEQTISKIKKGASHFTVKHIKSIGEVYNVNINWIFDIEEVIYLKNVGVQKVYKSKELIQKS